MLLRTTLINIALRVVVVMLSSHHHHYQHHNHQHHHQPYTFAVFVNRSYVASSFVTWHSGAGVGPFSAVSRYDEEDIQSVAQSAVEFVYVCSSFWCHCERVCGLVTAPPAFPTPLSPEHSVQFQLQQESDDGPHSTQGHCVFPSWVSNPMLLSHSVLSGSYEMMQFSLSSLHALKSGLGIRCQHIRVL